MKNVYIVYRVDGAYRYVQSVFTSKSKALRNIEEIRLELNEPYCNDGEFTIGGVRWTNEHNVICSAYISKEALR